MALDLNLEVVPVLNKIDLPNAEPERVRREIEDVIGLDTEGLIAASAKKGTGVPEILEAVVRKVPPPEGNPDAPTKALIVDSWFDNYVGVVILVRVFEGTFVPGQKILVMATGNAFEIQKVGVFNPYAAE